MTKSNHSYRTPASLTTGDMSRDTADYSDWCLVYALHQRTPNDWVWTLVEGVQGTYLVNGYGRLDRLGYYVSYWPFLPNLGR